MKIEYRYKWQEKCRSYTTCKNIEEITDWLKRFQNNTLEDYTECGNIEEIRLTLQESPYVVWIQMYKKIWGQWEICLILNDSPIGQLFSFEDVIIYLEKFINENSSK